jgi:hypothetical protein
MVTVGLEYGEGMRVSGATIMLTLHLSNEDHQMATFQFSHRKSKQNLFYAVTIALMIECNSMLKETVFLLVQNQF